MSAPRRKASANTSQPYSSPPMQPTRVAFAVAAAIGGAAIPLHTALADAPADATAPATSGRLEEIVVTARKREENLQDVPLSIDVFTQRDIQNLGIAQIEDYIQKTPSVSYLSTGPGTQVFVMRGVSDGSNPNYGNTSSTGFFVDDMSMSSGSAQPDLHLYDIERIEVLNGPQGTTFGAGAMSGAIRYITNKPDLNALSAGVDVDAGKIQNGQTNQTYEAFGNFPLISGRLGLRLSAFSVFGGGFINNTLTTRTWVNGSVSNNAPWARTNYNREHIEGARAALKVAVTDGWAATLSYGYQRQRTLGAWDEDPTLPDRTVARFGPEANDFQTKMIDGHLDGDLGIGDLVFAGTYWAQPRRQWNEYSEYQQNYNAGARTNPPGGFKGTAEGYTCLDDPYYGTSYQGCKPPTQYYDYIINPTRTSYEIRLASKPGTRFHWLGGFYWEKTSDKNYSNTYFVPNLVYQGTAFQAALASYYLTQPTLPPGVWYSYTERSDELRTTEFANISFDVTDRMNLEAGVVHFHSSTTNYTSFLAFAYSPNTPSVITTDSHKVNSKAGVNYKITDHALLYADFSQGFREGGLNGGLPPSCSQVPNKYTPDTLNNYEVGWKTTSLANRLLWNGALYYMDWKDLQTLIYNALVCPSSSYNINVGRARIYGGESNVDYRITDNFSLQASVNYTDPRITSAINPSYQAYVGERLPFAPYFSWSWNARYQQPLGSKLKSYIQFDMAHKGDMYNNLNPQDKNTGLPRVLQPAYTLMNLRLGLTPPDGNWITEFYIENLTDKNAIVYSNTGNFDLRLTTNEPRVYGIRVNYRFGKETNAE